jgi:hypothetical protein
MSMTFSILSTHTLRNCFNNESSSYFKKLRMHAKLKSSKSFKMLKPLVKLESRSSSMS